MGGGGGGYTDSMHGRSRVRIDRRIHTLPGRRSIDRGGIVNPNPKRLCAVSQANDTPSLMPTLCPGAPHDRPAAVHHGCGHVVSDFSTMVPGKS